MLWQKEMLTDSEIAGIFGKPFYKIQIPSGRHMNILEKVFSVFALLFGICLIASLILIPELRTPDRLIPVCIAGFAVNVGLLFVVLKDILSRNFSAQTSKYIWLILVLFLWPTIPFYLFRYGFTPRPAFPIKTDPGM